MSGPTRPSARSTPTGAPTGAPTGGAAGANGASGGLLLALLSAASFGVAGPFAKSLLEAGWSPGAAVVVRIAGAALVLAVPAAVSLRGRWSALRTHAGLIALYGLLAVAGAQLAFFTAVRTIPVGTALLIEYLAPLLVVVWVWVVRRHRPGVTTAVGAVIALGGVVLVLDVLAGGHVDAVGVGWALVAACGLAGYFLLAEREAPGLPPLVLAAGGLAVAAVLLVLAGVLGVLPMAANLDPVVLLGRTASPLVPLAGLVLLATALSYTTGTAAVRRLGSRLASFVGLTEVLFAVAFSWVLLGQGLGPVQVLGAVLVIAGVVVVRLDRSGDRRPEAAVAA